MQISAPVPLSDTYGLDDFDCGEAALDDWLKRRALKNESRFSRTYVVRDDNRVIAYCSISAGGVAREAAPSALRRNAPDPVPVAVIGRLAVDRACVGQGFGAALFADALRRIGLASQSIGIAAVLVHAKTADARRFYLARANFSEYPADSRTLFLRIEDVSASLG